jgi:hypothetical protein
VFQGSLPPKLEALREGWREDHLNIGEKMLKYGKDYKV